LFLNFLKSAIYLFFPFNFLFFPDFGEAAVVELPRVTRLVVAVLTVGPSVVVWPVVHYPFA
jgi:hypothetical protein